MTAAVATMFEVAAGIVLGELACMLLLAIAIVAYVLSGRGRRWY